MYDQSAFTFEILKLYDPLQQWFPAFFYCDPKSSPDLARQPYVREHIVFLTAIVIFYT